jgi:RNA polymerase sigma factor (sigma-70 family)
MMTDGAIRSLAQAVEAYYDELKNFLTRHTGSPGMAADIMQESWVRAASTASAAPIANHRAYLYRMVRNVAVDHLRREKRKSLSLDELPERTQLADAHPGPEATTAARQELALLTAAVQELPAKCRAVFLLYRGEGRSMREIATQLGISEKTVEKHIAKAMLHCRQRLREAGRDI